MKQYLEANLSYLRVNNKQEGGVDILVLLNTQINIVSIVYIQIRVFIVRISSHVPYTYWYPIKGKHFLRFSRNSGRSLGYYIHINIRIINKYVVGEV